MMPVSVRPEPLQRVAVAGQLADDLASALDPVVFAERLGLVPDPWQADVLRSGDHRVLLNCSRQVGKSTVAGIAAVHRAVYVPGSLVVLVAPSLRQSLELFRVVRRLHDATGETLPYASASRMELTNGSRVVSLPGTEETIRGISGVDLLVIDEASRVEDALYLSVTPMLATTGGRLLAMSTPFGRRGWWANAWHRGASWKRVKITAHDCPRISAAYLAEQQQSMGALWFAQEFLGEFSDSTASAFRAADIAAAREEKVEVWRL